MRVTARPVLMVRRLGENAKGVTLVTLSRMERGTFAVVANFKAANASRGLPPTAPVVCTTRPAPPPRVYASVGVRMIFLTFSAGLGAILLLLAAPQRNQYLIAGPLTRHHSVLVRPETEVVRCEACHQAAEVGLAAWTVSALLPGSIGTSQTDRCVECHRESIPPEFAWDPHTLSPDEVDAITAKRTNLDERLPQGAPLDRLACSACHREHHGADADLTALTNAQCATCHQNAFATFADHPEFRPPSSRPFFVSFHHGTHSAKHFPQANKPFACQTCHIEQDATNPQRYVRFAQACAACHEEKIRRSFQEGVPILALPLLDTERLRDVGLEIGEWPAKGDFDGSLPPLMRALLSGDTHTRAAMDQFRVDFDFLDLDPDNFDDLDAAAQIAWGIKQLIYRLLHEPDTNAYLGTLLGGPAGGTQDLPPFDRGALLELQRRWFPNLEKEMAARRDHTTVPAPSNEALTANALEFTQWLRDDDLFRYSYVPTGHADRFLRNWIEALRHSERSLWNRDLQLAWHSLASPNGPGLCATCHSPISPAARSSHAYLWKAQAPTQRATKNFTRFSHQPHLTLNDLQDCTQCHVVAESVVDHGGNDFQPFTKSQCATCHSDTTAGNRCTTCHNYHVHPATWASPRGLANRARVPSADTDPPAGTSFLRSAGTQLPHESTR